MGSETCDSAVELEMLASGMAKQHENFLDATQELIDNSVAAVVDGENYFDDANKRVNISISFVRGEDETAAGDPLRISAGASAGETV